MAPPYLTREPGDLPLGFLQAAGNGLHWGEPSLPPHWLPLSTHSNILNH